MMQIWQMILDFDKHLPELISMHAGLVYVILFAVIYLQIGTLPLFFLPSNPFLFVSGAAWAAAGLNIWLLLPLLILAAFLGNLTGYWIGGTLGQKFFVRYLKWPSQTSLDKTHAFFEKNGEKSFLISLFLPIIRTLAPFLAGVSSMSFIKFVRASAAGSVIWVLVCVLAGYFFGNIPVVKTHLGLITVLGLAMVIAVVLLKKLWNTFAKK